MNENNGVITDIVSWVRSERVFKKRATNRVNQDVINMMNARVN